MKTLVQNVVLNDKIVLNHKVIDYKLIVCLHTTQTYEFIF